MNEILEFEQAIPIEPEFLAISDLVPLASIPLVNIAVIISIFVARNRKADFKKYRTTVDQLKSELE